MAMRVIIYAEKGEVPNVQEQAIEFFDGDDEDSIYMTIKGQGQYKLDAFDFYRAATAFKWKFVTQKDG